MPASILLLPGDGIGPEVMGEVRKLTDHLRTHHALDCTIEEDLVGGCAYEAHGKPLADHTLQKAMAADVVLLGSVGGPKWDGVDYALRPEAGLLKLRKEMALFANLRPALVFEPLINASTLKPEVVRGLDILIVRELTGGVYFGEPRGITTLADGQRQGLNTQVYTSHEIMRVAKVAFELAYHRARKVCSVEKANVMESGKLWREEVSKLHKESYADIELSHMYADNCAMQLLKNPRQFDVIVTDNLFGDILSDEAAMLTGSLGMLPSASLGAKDPATGKQRALYEPIHGSAPDIAGLGKANPLAAILSLAMALRFSLNRADLADLVEQAVNKVLAQGTRTADILGDLAATGTDAVTTEEMGTAVICALAG